MVRMFLDVSIMYNIVTRLTLCVYADTYHKTYLEPLIRVVLRIYIGISHDRLWFWICKHYVMHISMLFSIYK